MSNDIVYDVVLPDVEGVPVTASVVTYDVIEVQGPQGIAGPVGPANVLSIGTVTKGDDADASITGDSPDQVLNLTLPKGDPGDLTDIVMGTVTTLDPGEPATAEFTGDAPTKTLNLGLPQGASGTGDVSSVNTVAPDGEGNVTLTASDVGALPSTYAPASTDISDATTVGKALLTAASQAAGRTAIGAGTSSFDGAYGSLTGTPTLGTAAAKDTGTTSGTVAAGDDSRFIAISATTKTAAYTLAAADAGTVVEVNSSSALTVTVPNSVFAAGDIVEVCQYGSGQVTVAAGTGVTLRNASSLKTRAQYSSLSIRFRTASEAIVSGDMA